MPQLENIAIGVIKNSDSDAITGLYKVDGEIKTFTGLTCAQDAVTEISDVYGNKEFDVAQVVQRTYTEVVTT